jgi:hypothetical protein
MTYKALYAVIILGNRSDALIFMAACHGFDKLIINALLFYEIPIFAQAKFLFEFVFALVARVARDALIGEPLLLSLSELPLPKLAVIVAVGGVCRCDPMASCESYKKNCSDLHADLAFWE